MMIMEFLEKLSDALYYIDGYSPLSASEWHLAPQKSKLYCRQAPLVCQIQSPPLPLLGGTTIHSKNICTVGYI